MKKNLFAEEYYAERLWEKYEEAVLNDKTIPSHYSKYEKLKAKVEISKNQLRRYDEANSVGNIRQDKLQELLNYLGIKNYAQFKDIIDAEAENGGHDKNLNLSKSSREHHYNIPARPEYFIGRKAKLIEIHKALAAPSTRQNILLLNSIGGMGKTTLIHEYLNSDNCRDHFDYIITMAVNKNLEQIFVSIVAHALNINLSDTYIPERKLEIVIERMRAITTDNLLVIDNINEYDYDDLLAIIKHLKQTGWRVLIGTRTLPDNIKSIEVDELNMDDAILLFLHHYLPEYAPATNEKLWKQPKLSKLKDDIELLLSHIDRHTLLTELLAKTGNKKGINPALLLKHLKEEDIRHNDINRTIDIGRHQETTFSEHKKATLHQYMMSIFDTDYLLKKTNNKNIDTENKAKTTMLHFFSVLPSDDIPLEYLRALWNITKKEENVFEDRLDELKQIGWIQGKQEKSPTLEYALNFSYKMHHLIQEVVHEKLKTNKEVVTPLMRNITKILSNPSTPTAILDYAQSISDKLDDFEE
jgi:hypothetical protein